MPSGRSGPRPDLPRLASPPPLTAPSRPLQPEPRTPGRAGNGSPPRTSGSGWSAASSPGRTGAAGDDIQSRSGRGAPREPRPTACRGGLATRSGRMQVTSLNPDVGTDVAVDGALTRLARNAIQSEVARCRSRHFAALRPQTDAATHRPTSGTTGSLIKPFPALRNARAIAADKKRAARRGVEAC
jgi:hypothetical protein